MDVQVLSFRRPKQVIKGFPLEKRKQVRVVELPTGTQLLDAEDQSHEGVLMLWVMLPTTEGLPTEKRTILVTYEGEEFEVEEDLIPGVNLTLFNVQHIGMWVDRTIIDGELCSVTGHVLEVLDES